MDLLEAALAAVTQKLEAAEQSDKAALVERLKGQLTQAAAEFEKECREAAAVIATAREIFGRSHVPRNLMARQCRAVESSGDNPLAATLGKRTSG